MSYARLIFAAGAAAFLGSTSAFGTSVFVQVDASYFSAVVVDRTVDTGANWITENPGQFHILTQAGSPANIPPDFYTFCIEPLEIVTPGDSYTYELSPVEQGATNIGGMGTTKANLVRELLFTYYPNFQVALDNNTAAALQVALWEIVGENSGTLDLAAGNVQYRNWSDTAVRDQAAAMLSSLTGSGPQLGNVSALTLDLTQDLLVQTTPEPSTVLLAGPVLLLLALRRRRQKKYPQLL